MMAGQIRRLMPFTFSSPKSIPAAQNLRLASSRLSPSRPAGSFFQWPGSTSPKLLPEPTGDGREGGRTEAQPCAASPKIAQLRFSGSIRRPHFFGGGGCAFFAGKSPELAAAGHRRRGCGLACWLWSLWAWMLQWRTLQRYDAQAGRWIDGGFTAVMAVLAMGLLAS